jgi:hypothetical protein
MPSKNTSYKGLYIVLPSVKIDKNLKQMIDRSQSKIPEITLQDFRRAALLFFCQKILTGKLKLRQKKLEFEEN